MTHRSTRACSRRGRFSFWTLAAALALPTSGASWPASADAQGRPSSAPFQRIQYVLDASGSMRARFGQRTKLDVAVEMLAALDEELARMGAAPKPYLWAYGATSPRRERNCADSELVARGREPLGRALAGLAPTGVSPLVHALDRVLASEGGAGAEAWVLFTDGSDNCGRDPCEWAGRALALPARPLIYVVGLGAGEEDARGLRCLTQTTSGYLLDLQPDSVWNPQVRRLAAVIADRGSLRVEVRAADETPSLQGRLFRVGSTEPLRAFRTGRDEEVPAGMYRVVVETVPPTAVERVLVLPGGQREVVIDDLASLSARVYTPGNEPVAAYATLAGAAGEGEAHYFPAGQAVYVRPGRYSLTLEVGDSVALRQTVEIAPGEFRTVSAGGTGWVRALAPGLPQVADVDVELQAYETGRSSAVRPWRSSVGVPAGEYRAVVRSLPVYVQERLTVAPAETSAVVVPGLGTLRVELVDLGGRPLSVPVTLLRAAVREGEGEDAGAVIGTFLSGVEQAVMAGTYDLLLETRPSRVERGVRVQPGATRIVSLAVPAVELEGS